MTNFKSPLLLMLCVVVLASCRQTKVSDSQSEPLQMMVDTLKADSLEQEIPEFIEEVKEEEEFEYIDGDFDDFMFTFVRNNKLQKERVKYPLPFIAPKVDSTIYYLNCRKEFEFLNNDFFTILYGDPEQIEEVKNLSGDSVSVERIDLDRSTINRYDFCRLDGKWMLTGICQSGLNGNELADFFVFYHQFSCDSIYQMGHISQPLKFGMIDPDDEGNYIEGTLDAQQWFSFCPEVPTGLITNIRYGQRYTPEQVVLQKCGMANGMEEIFTFRRMTQEWMLTSYEN